jgi:hypothetical protein
LQSMDCYIATCQGLVQFRKPRHVRGRLQSATEGPGILPIAPTMALRGLLRPVLRSG